MERKSSVDSMLGQGLQHWANIETTSYEYAHPDIEIEYCEEGASVTVR